MKIIIQKPMYKLYGCLLEVRQEQLPEELKPIANMCRGLVLLRNGKEHNGYTAIRPVKNTTTNECYEALYGIIGYLNSFRDLPEE